MKEAGNRVGETLGAFVKEELEWEGEGGVSKAAVRAGLFADHEVKQELVLGPELLQPQDIAYKILHKPVTVIKAEDTVKKEQSPQPQGCEPLLDARCLAQLLTTCYVGLHRLPDLHPRTAKEKVTEANTHPATSDISQDSPSLTDNTDPCEKNDAVNSKHDPEMPEAPQEILDTKSSVTPVKVRKGRRKRRIVNIYPCDTCGEEFTAKKKLNAHAGEHRLKKTPRKVREARYSCDACGRKYAEKKQLLFHMLVHMGLRPYACMNCDKRYTCASRLERHELTHTGRKKYTCDICDGRFTTKYSLTRHILAHSGEKPYTCEVCQKRFSFQSYLARHKLLHSGRKTYSCNVCNMQFFWRSALIQHTGKHSGVKYICEVCGKSFARIEGLRRHYLIHKGIKPYPCTYCKKKFRTKFGLRGHVRRVHAKQKHSDRIGVDTSYGLKETQTEESTNICRMDNQSPTNCGAQYETDTGKVLQSEASIENNSDSVIEQQSLRETPHFNSENTANLCISKDDHSGNTKESQSTETIQVHKDALDLREPKNHPAINNNTQPPNKTICTLISNKNTLNCELNETDSADNNERHTVEIPLTHTEKGFGKNSETLSPESSASSNLNLDAQTETSRTCHEVIDLISSFAAPQATDKVNVKLEFTEEFVDIESKPYSCDTCGKRYAEKKHLIPHCRSHMDDLSCIVCKKTYTRSFFLVRHLYTHLEKPKYTCEICDAELSSQHSLERHKRIHARPVKRKRCDICKKRFVHSSDLRKHLKTHTGLKPFPCDVCEKKFGTQGNLNRHKVTHETQKPFSCEICHKRFSSREYVKVHTRIHTGEKPYYCEICDERFVYENIYLNHKRRHQGMERKFCCQVCGAGFTHSVYLKRHTQIHTGLKPFSCDRCDKRFYTKCHLKRHVNDQKRPCAD